MHLSRYVFVFMSVYLCECVRVRNFLILFLASFNSYRHLSSPSIRFHLSLQIIEDISNKNEEDISNHKTLLENTISTHKKDLEVLEIVHNSHVKQQLSALKGQLDTTMSLEKERGLRLLSDLRAEQVREVFELKEQHDMNVQAA